LDILHHNTIGSGSNHLAILHGFLGMGDNWKSLAKAWSKKNFNVHLIDQRNHGRSFWSPYFDYQLMAQDLLHWMDKQQIGQLSLLGHSMGGKTAMTFASENADRIDRLLIADISPRAYPPHHELILSSLAALDFNKIKNRKEADEALAVQIKELSTRQFLLKNLYWKNPEQLGLRVNIEVLQTKGTTIGKSLAKNTVCTLPTLFLAGGNSQYILPEDHLLIKKHFPKAALVTIPKAGHWLHAENPLDFSKAVLQFLKG
tara:strand:+ start:95 stop:868 length:774 start_codon:yes stop_codon:yes gene_type:complete